MRLVLKVGKVLLIVIVVGLVGAFVVLYVNSPGTPEPFSDQEGEPLEGSISTIEAITIGDIDQYLIIRGADTTKPVLLFLHGGPGFPEFIFFNNDQLNLEKEFVVVYWEQRGAGKSLTNAIPEASMTIEQFVSDASEVSAYVRKRFNQPKIFLMGHSWGSLLGMLTVHQHPHHFYAYIGIGQMVNQYEAEHLSLNWVKNEAQHREDRKAIKKLAPLRVPDSLADGDAWLDFLVKERKYVQLYGGGVDRTQSNVWIATGKMALTTQEYTIKDKINLIRGNPYSVNRLWPAIVQSNLLNEIDSVATPVHFIQGLYDYQTPHVLAKRFYEQLKAPQKTFHSFDSSAHAPFLDELEKFNTVIQSILLASEEVCLLNHHKYYCHQQNNRSCAHQVRINSSREVKGTLPNQ
ncbi:MAG: alpha/beta hydrolase [Bacteroidota bacterium]